MNPRILAAIFAAAALPVAAQSSPVPQPSPAAKPEAHATPAPKAAAPQGTEAAKLAKAQNKKPRKKGETPKSKKAAAT